MATAFDGIHNYHIKCGIHRLERALKAVFENDDEMKELRKVLSTNFAYFSRYVLILESADGNQESC